MSAGKITESISSDGPIGSITAYGGITSPMIQVGGAIGRSIPRAARGGAADSGAMSAQVVAGSLKNVQVSGDFTGSMTVQGALGRLQINGGALAGSVLAGELSVT